MNLSALAVQSRAIVAQSVSAVASLAFRLRYIAAWGTRAVVMINAFVGRLFDFIDGIDLRYFRHRFPFVRGCPNANERPGIVNRSFRCKGRGRLRITTTNRDPNTA